MSWQGTFSVRVKNFLLSPIPKIVQALRPRGWSEKGIDMQATEATVLLQNLVSLNEGFSQLGVRLSQAANALQTTGMPPASTLIEEINSSRRSFAELCAKSIALAEVFSLTPMPKPETIVSLGDLQALLQALNEAEEKRKVVKELTQQALSTLDRLYAIKHREREVFAPLAECQMRATVLRNAIAETPWPKVHPSIEDLGKAENPFVALLLLVEHGEELDDDQCIRCQDIVERVFSRPLAVAALRGKLTLLSETSTAHETLTVPPAVGGTTSDRNSGASSKRSIVEPAPAVVAAPVARELPSEKPAAPPFSMRNGNTEVAPIPPMASTSTRAFAESSTEAKSVSSVETPINAKIGAPENPSPLAAAKTQIAPDTEDRNRLQAQPTPLESGPVNRTFSPAPTTSQSDGDPILVPASSHEKTARVAPRRGAGIVDVLYRFEIDDKAQKIANMLLSGAYRLGEEKPAFVRDLVWRLIFEEKLTLAFHVARCLEAQYPDFHPRLPSWLLRSIVLGQRVRNPQGEIGRFLKDDFAHCDTDCRTTGDKEWDLAVEFLLLAGAFVPALLAPDTRASTILHGVCLGEGLENLSAFCNVVAVYGDLFIPLDPTLMKKPVRPQGKEPGGFMRRLIGNQEGGARKDVMTEQAEPLRIEVMNRHQAVLEELSQFRNTHSSILLLGGLAACRRAVESVVLLFDAEAPFSSDEPLPRPLLNADLSRIPTLVLNKQGEVEGADQAAFLENVLRLVASGPFKMI